MDESPRSQPSRPAVPPELEGVRWADDDAPRRPSPWVRLVVWICILGLVLSVMAGLLGSF